MKILVHFLGVLICVYSCTAQNSISLSSGKTGAECSLTMVDSPKLQGYKLGMDISEMEPKQIVGRAGGNKETYIKIANDDTTCYLTFEIKKLKTITVLYKSLKFDGVDAFVGYLNKAFDLPDFWIRQTPKQREIESQLAELEQQMATVVALRNLMFQIHGRSCRQAKRMEREIPKLLKAESRLQERRQIGSRLNCDGFSLSAFIDNSMDKAVPAMHLFLPEPKSEKTHKR